MAAIMQRAIDIDEVNSTSQEERINALLLENRGLKEILAVHEQMHQSKPSPPTTSQPEVRCLIPFLPSWLIISFRTCHLVK